MSDLISRQNVLDAIDKRFVQLSKNPVFRRKHANIDLYGVKGLIRRIPSAEPKTRWIPVKWHEITDEEREREGYPKDWVVHIDCDMPCDGDEILVQTKQGYIRWDVCYEDGEFSLDSGWDWIEDIVAWMPLPKPWKDGE